MPKVLRTGGMNKCTGCFTCMLVCSTVNKKDHSFEKSAIKVKTSGGLKGRFISEVCVGCTKNISCMEACKSGALTARDGGGVILAEDKCIGCRKCVSACSVMAIHFDEDTKTPIICKHCGVCARFCPHHCLTMEEKNNAV